MDAKDYINYAIRTESTDKDKFSYKCIQKLIDFSIKLGLNYNKTISYRMTKIRNLRLLHASIGLSTETVEIVEFLEKDKLDIVNLGEELADGLWYLALIIDEYKIDPYILDTKFIGEIETIPLKENLTKSTHKLIIQGGNLLDLVKKGLFYGKEIPQEKIIELLTSIITEMDKMCQIANIDLVQSRTINIEKLAKRYGEKFSEFKAINRDLSTERSILNKIQK